MKRSQLKLMCLAEEIAADCPRPYAETICRVKRKAIKLEFGYREVR